MLIIFFSLLLAAVYIFIIAIFQKKMQFNFSDHYFHVGLIEAIKKNNHKFVLEHPNFIVEKNFAYPQLYHWLISFFPSKYYLKYHFWLNMIFNWILILLVFIFSSYLLKIQGVLAYKELAGNVIIVLAFTPFLYLPWNAKNLGISPRNFGFIAVTSLNFALLCFKINPTIGYACWILFSIFIIILSSQMAHQYLLLGLIPISIIISPIVIILYLIAVALCFLLLPKIMKKYFIGQFWHKYLFSKYLVQEYILSARESIWLDFPFGFYKKFKMNFKEGIMYFYSNPILLILWSIPVLLPSYYFGSYKHTDFSRLLIYFNAIGFILFFLTSFRVTRFLGEPERYVEFFIPTIALQLFYALSENISTKWLIAICIYSSITIIFLFLIEYRSVSKTSAKKQKDLDEMFFAFLPKIVGEKKLISNSWHVMRRFYSTDIKTFTPNFTSLKTGSIPLTDIFKESFIYLDHRCIESINKSYQISYCIVDSRVIDAANWNNALQKHAYKIEENNIFSLFKFLPQK